MATISNLIQIKRSNTTAVPSSLQNGEMAWSNTSGVLYIGAYGSVTAIGGVRNPGVLTANQALVANSTGGINYVITSNLITTSITTGDGYYNPNTQIAASNKGYILSVDGSGVTFWRDANTLSVSPSYVQNTDSRTLSGNLYFTGANTTIDNLRIGSGVLSGNGSGLTSVNAAQLGGQTLTQVLSTASGYADSAFANSVLRSDAAFANAYAKATSYADTAAATAFANSVLRSDAAFSNAVSVSASYADQVAGNAFSNAYAKAISTAQGYADSAFSNAYTKAIGTAQGYADNAYTNATAWAYNNLVSSITAANGIIVGGTASVPSIAVKVASGNGVYLNGNGLYIGQDVSTTANVTFNVGNFTAIYSNTTITANTGTIAHDLYVGGQLFVVGNVVSANIETIQVTDSLIKLASNNYASDILDIGFYGQYNDGTGNTYTGLVRDASDKSYHLFEGEKVEPYGAVLDFNNVTEATLHTRLHSPGLIVDGSSVIIEANSTLTVNITANTLTLANPLAYTSGGTGYNTYNQGDLLVGNTTGGAGLSKLALAATGYLLMSDGTNLVYSTLDGGTF